VACGPCLGKRGCFGPPAGRDLNHFLVPLLCFGFVAAKKAPRALGAFFVFPLFSYSIIRDGDELVRQVDVAVMVEDRMGCGLTGSVRRSRV
jgi:hypothetical protein